MNNEQLSFIFFIRFHLVWKDIKVAAMGITDVVAWIGAITGTGALLWDIYKWKHSGPKLKVSVSPGMALYLPGRPETSDRFLLVRVVNIGHSKTTLNTLSFLHSDFPLRKSKKKPVNQFVVTRPDPGKLPHVLEPGEEWVGMAKQDDKMNSMMKKGYLYCRVYHSLSDQPAVARVTDNLDVIKKKTA